MIRPGECHHIFVNFQIKGLPNDKLPVMIKDEFFYTSSNSPQIKKVKNDIQSSIWIDLIIIRSEI